MSDGQVRVYTIEEARILNAIEGCRRHGHTWQEVRGDNKVISMFCSDCGARALVEEPEMPEGRMIDREPAKTD